MVIPKSIGAVSSGGGPAIRERTARVSEQPNTPNYIELAADLVSAFVSNNPVPAAELPALIGNVHAALTKVANGPSEQAKAPARGRRKKAA